MLDLGIGAGRTAYTFAAITRRYVGVDYSPKMIELCRDQFPEGPSVKFIVGDASDLSLSGQRLSSTSSFSASIVFNSIDYVTRTKGFEC
jgi:ubiquinone/menaquinone biosynthesis C-methylase UbiE